MRRIFFIALTLLSVALSSQDIVYIRAFSHLKVNSATFTVEKSSYDILGDEKLIMKNSGETILKLTAVNDSVEVKSFETIYGRFKTVKMMSDEGELKLKLVSPDRKQRIYPDNYMVTSELGNLKLINAVKLDSYIAGVVEAESGVRSAPEFYKVQAILAPQQIEQ